MRRNIDNLQVLRGIAASAVVLLHVAQTGRDYGAPAPILASLGGWGASGVDVFFALSGFIMVYSQLGRSTSPSRFLLDRIKRIVPSYWAMTLLLLALLAIMPGLFNQLHLDLGHALASLLFVSRAAGFDNPYIFVGWTLEYEALFYAVFAVSLLFPATWQSLLFLTATVAALPLVSDVGLILYEFLFGVLAAFLVRFGPFPRALHAAVLAAGTALLLVTVGSEVPTEARRVMVWGVPAALIVFGAYGVGQASARPLIFFGDASYSIYLIQVFTIPAFYKLLQVAGLLDLPGDLLGLAGLAGSLAAGCAWHWFFDDPVRRLLKRPRRLSDLQGSDGGGHSRVRIQASQSGPRARP